MEIIQISATYHRRIQVKQYEPAEAGNTITATIGPDEDVKASIKKLYAIAREMVHIELAKDLKTQDRLTEKLKNL